MIAAFCTLSDETIVCMEEPEIHLHPILQRKLIHYLRENTKNQYFIATHSAALIDTDECAIFHVLKDSQTRIEQCIFRSEKLKICTNLGYKASDILQSNFIVWVEGPSDRIYINHWIKLKDRRLIEGLHYSVMFYGGRLLSHLSAEDDEVTEFINLRSMNQHLAVVMDSDRTSATRSINSTKQRIVDEFSSGSGLAWVTAGREIENYIDYAKLHQAIRDIYPKSYKEYADSNIYAHALFFKKEVLDGEKNVLYKDVDKLKVARRVTVTIESLDVLDLDERMTILVNAINAAN